MLWPFLFPSSYDELRIDSKLVIVNGIAGKVLDSYANHSKCMILIDDKNWGRGASAEYAFPTLARARLCLVLYLQQWTQAHITNRAPIFCNVSKGPWCCHASAGWEQGLGTSRGWCLCHRHLTKSLAPVMITRKFVAWGLELKVCRGALSSPHSRGLLPWEDSYALDIRSSQINSRQLPLTTFEV